MLTFLFKNLLIFTQNFSLSNVEKKIFLSSLFLKKNYQIFKIWKKFMHKNAIKIVGGVKFSKKIPQNVGFFVQKVWDFWHWGGDKIVGFSASRGGFSPFNFWPHWNYQILKLFEQLQQYCKGKKCSKLCILSWAIISWLKNEALNIRNGLFNIKAA